MLLDSVAGMYLQFVTRANCLMDICSADQPVFLAQCGLLASAISVAAGLTTVCLWQPARVWWLLAGVFSGAVLGARAGNYGNSGVRCGALADCRFGTEGGEAGWAGRAASCARLLPRPGGTRIPKGQIV